MYTNLSSRTSIFDMCLLLCCFLILASTNFYLILGFDLRGIPSSDRYGLELYIKYDGYDCLKQIQSTSNLTLDKTYTPDQERNVLLDIYHSTNGHNWYNQSGWNTPNQTSHCNWYGISCHDNTSYVKSIMIAFNNLEGILPENLWKLRNLMSLCIPGHPKLYGNLQDFVFANMTELRIIIISGASIAGRITEAVGHLSSLERFLACVMYGQGLSGPLPDNLGNMTELRLLCLGGNNITGQIPRSISRLTKLFYLDLRNAPGKLSGHLEDLLSISSMIYLYVEGVELKGKITAVPPKIVILVLTGNKIKGTLPKEFPKCLTDLDVANNELTGNIPGQLFLLPNIRKVDVSQNLFTSVNNGSSWPPNNQSVLRYVSLAENRNLTINIESFLLTLRQSYDNGNPTLSVLNMSFCDLRGSLPERLLTFSGITVCDLRSNGFTGSIPQIILDSSYLTYLDVSFNDLSGDLPLGISSLISLQYLDISSNPQMQQTEEKSKDLLHPDFTKMSKSQPEANFKCAEGRLTFNNGRVRLDPTFYRYKYCICDSGFYGDSGLCKKCMSGGTCQKPVVMTTNVVQTSTMKINAGYWPSPSASKVTHLVRCPVPEACSPHGDCTCLLQTSSNLTSQSSNRSSSSLLTSCNTSCICHHGNTDRFCSRCERGFYKTGGLCFPCPKAKDNPSFYIFIPVFAVSVLFMLCSFLYFKVAPKTAFVIVAMDFLVMFVFTFLKMMPTWVFKLDVVIFVLCMSNRVRIAHPLIKIGIFYIQTLDSMVSTFDVWPRQIFAVQHYFSSFWNLHFASLSCEFSILFDPVARFAFVLLLPLFCILFIGLYLVISTAYDKLKHQEDRIQSTRFKGRKLTMSCLNFAYFPIVQATVSVLRPCGDDQGVRFMPKTPWIECKSPTYHVLSIMGWLSVVVYVLGFPVLLLTLIAVFFRKRSSMSVEEKKDMDSWLGPLYLPYKPQFQLYFEIILVIRRLLLAFFLSFLASLGSVQTVIVWLILILSAIIQFRLQPYQTSGKLCPFENIFEFVILFVLSMSFMVLRFAVLGSPFTNLFVWFVMIVNGCVLIALISCILYLFGLSIPFCCSRRSVVVRNDNKNIFLGNPTEDYEPIE